MFILSGEPGSGLVLALDLRSRWSGAMNKSKLIPLSMGLHFVSMKNKHPALGIYKLGYLLSMIYLREDHARHTNLSVSWCTLECYTALTC